MKSLDERLRYGCGDPVRDTALMLEAADALASQAAEIELLTKERDMLCAALEQRGLRCVPWPRRPHSGPLT